MRAVLLKETGGPEVLRVEEVERPEPGDGELLIAVRAASINPIDWKQRRGLSPKELPAVLGNDISGVVEVSRADGFAEGDEVFGFARTGGYAEYAATPAQIVARKPAGLSHEQAAALPVGALTAWQALFDRATATTCSAWAPTSTSTTPPRMSPTSRTTWTSHSTRWAERRPPCCCRPCARAVRSS